MEYPVTTNTPDYGRAEPERTSVDRLINRVIDHHVASKLATDQQLFMRDCPSLGDSVATTCYELGSAMDDGQVSSDAVLLRSLHLVRYLDGVRVCDSKPQRDYHLPVLNNTFWTAVDHLAEAHLAWFAQDEYDAELAPVDRDTQDHGEGYHENTQQLGRFAGYTLLRQSCGWDDHISAVYYIAERN